VLADDSEPLQRRGIVAGGQGNRRPDIASVRSALVDGSSGGDIAPRSSVRTGAFERGASSPAGWGVRSATVSTADVGAALGMSAFRGEIEGVIDIPRARSCEPMGTVSRCPIDCTASNLCCNVTSGDGATGVDADTRVSTER
jgi:hypothetical protein